MYDDILVPIDGSEPSDAALEHAHNLAVNEVATAHVIHSIELRSRGLTFGRVPATAMTDIREESKEMVEEATEELEESGVDTTSEILKGAATEAIPEYAENQDIDLIVMGTHGRTGVERLLLGSATERTLRMADAPVLAVEPS